MAGGGGDDVSTTTLTPQDVVTANTAAGQWKLRKGDLRNLSRQSDFVRTTTFTASDIFGLKSDGSSRTPSFLQNRQMTIAKMRTAVDGATDTGREAARKLARANQLQSFDRFVYAPLDQQGDCVSFQIDGDRVIEIGIKTPAATISDDALYEWFVMSDTTETATIVKQGEVIVSGEATTELTISVDKSNSDSSKMRYRFQLGSVTTLGSETTSTAGGDPYVQSLF